MVTSTVSPFWMYRAACGRGRRAGGAGDDDVAGLQGDDVRDVVDELGRGEHQVPSVRGLHDFTFENGLDLGAERVVGVEERSEAAGLLEGLALVPLQRAVLVVAHRVVVDHRVACDVVGGIVLGHLVGLLADDDSQFRFPVELRTCVFGHDHIVVGASEGFLELREQGRELGEVAAHLLDVRCVVQADTHDLAGAGHHRCVIGVREVDGLAGSLFGDGLPACIVEQRGQVGVTVDHGCGGAAVDPHGSGRAVEAESGESHEFQAPSEMMVRLKWRRSTIGASENANRSIPLSVSSDHSVHDGTTIMSPLATSWL